MIPGNKQRDCSLSLFNTPQTFFIPGDIFVEMDVNSGYGVSETKERPMQHKQQITFKKWLIL